MKTRLLEKLLAVVCALCLAAGVMSGVVLAKDEEPSDAEQQPEATFVVLDLASNEAQTASVEISDEIIDNRTSIPCFINGIQWGECPLINGVPYVSVTAFCEALGLAAQTSLSEGTLLMTADGLTLTATADGNYFVCNGRYLYVENGVVLQDGEIFLPVEALVKCFGVTVTLDQLEWVMTIQEDAVVPLEAGDTFYDETDVYWLSRVIYAEAGGQSLEEQLGIGDVVMNRIASELFGEQDSVYDVIFAKNQFEVVVNGMIYMTPDDDAQIAAKLALEGYDVVSGAVYFATEESGASVESVCWLGGHCFMTVA